MHPLPSIKRELSLGIAVSALVFLCALAWGSPFLAVGSGAASVAQMQQTHTQPITFTGTIVRNGGQLVLRDFSGRIYRLDDSQDAQSFEGKAVKVAGNLDAGATLIHVERIEPAIA